MGAIPVREYGSTGPIVVLVHGGPGAPGYMAPVARELASEFRVLEPLQRASGGESLTVAVHLADLSGVVESYADGPVSLVGSSWGAMLALAYAAAQPARARGVVAIGCGTFDEASRSLYKQTLNDRMSAELQEELRRIETSVADPDERLRRRAELLLPVYSYRLMSSDLEMEAVDARSNQETWADMLRLQEQGIYPQAFRSIEAPVLMLHGARDPHPGRQISASLARYVRRLEYQEWEECGHYPWLEREVRTSFFARLSSQLREWS